MERGHLDPCVAKLRRERLHHPFFSVSEERARRARVRMPFQQRGLVGVGRESVDRVDLGSHRQIIPQNTHRVLTVDDLPRQRSLLLKY
jgi:hypothetical protein